MMGEAEKLEQALGQLLETLRPNAKSLIVSIFGDAILPHGGAVWLGSLVQLVEPFGINDRGVRTSVFRLSKDGLLTSQQVGRRSYYALTESGRLRFEAAHRAIYASARKPWDKAWTIVFTGLVDGEAREALRQDLAWQGFGQLTAGVMVHPDPDSMPLRAALEEARAQGRAVVLRAHADEWHAETDQRTIAAKAWDLDRLSAVYQAFLLDFRPFLRLLEQVDAGPDACFRLRTLLIHAYRRALLRDPMLPDELMSPNWPGAAARLLCRNLYRKVQAGAEQHLGAVLETVDGPIPPADARYFERFGGLEASI